MGSGGVLDLEQEWSGFPEELNGGITNTDQPGGGGL